MATSSMLAVVVIIISLALAMRVSSPCWRGRIVVVTSWATSSSCHGPHHLNFELRTWRTSAGLPVSTKFFVETEAPCRYDHLTDYMVKAQFSEGRRAGSASFGDLTSIATRDNLVQISGAIYTQGNRGSRSKPWMPQESTVSSASFW